MQRYRNCKLCPRQCGADRVAGQTGFCGESAVCRIAFAGPHYGEEPCFSGARGSGTIFFCGCSSQCFFCQNHQISRGREGRAATEDGLLDLAENLAKRGVHNLNFVTPDHFWPHIERLGRRLRERGHTLPFLFNSSGYQEPAMVPAYAGIMDIFMPDFKFADPELAHTCMRDRRYPDITREAIRRMVAAKGFLEPWDDEGRIIARRGVLVRHLVLPGYVENTRQVLRLLRAEFGPLLPLSVMSQFRPVETCLEQGHLDRTVTAEEYDQVCDLVGEMGFERVFIQPRAGDPDFLPDFSKQEPFAGNVKQADPAHLPAGDAFPRTS
ncbi:MAG: radical SAM protein [Kiritimatiellaeota bacterium]|nr:radical SAM protein [Kiritimatiellota bacterium]